MKSKSLIDEDHSVESFLSKASRMASASALDIMKRRMQVINDSNS
jgi:hypothetical protein